MDQLKEIKATKDVMNKISTIFKKCYITNTGYCMFIDDNPLDKLMGKFLCVLSDKSMELLAPIMRGNKMIYIDAVDEIKKVYALAVTVYDIRTRLDCWERTNFTRMETEEFLDSSKLTKPLKDFIEKMSVSGELRLPFSDMNIAIDNFYKRRYVAVPREKVSQIIYTEIDELNMMHCNSEKRYFFPKEMIDAFDSYDSYNLRVPNTELSITVGKKLFPYISVKDLPSTEYFVHKCTDELWLFGLVTEDTIMKVYATYGVIP